MEDDIHKNVLTVVFRGTPCTFFITPLVNSTVLWLSHSITYEKTNLDIPNLFRIWIFSSIKTIRFPPWFLFLQLIMIFKSWIRGNYKNKTLSIFSYHEK